jgi:hypothetical protein
MNLKDKFGCVNALLHMKKKEYLNPPFKQTVRYALKMIYSKYMYI